MRARSGTERGDPHGLFDTNRLHEATLSGCPWLAGGLAPKRSHQHGCRIRHGRGSWLHLLDLLRNARQQTIEVFAQFNERQSVCPRGCSKDIYTLQHKMFTHFHKFTKLTAHSVSAHGRTKVAAQGVSHLGNRERRIEIHRARQGSGADMDSLLAKPEKSRSALDTTDQALRR